MHSSTDIVSQNGVCFTGIIFAVPPFLVKLLNLFKFFKHVCRTLRSLNRKSGELGKLVISIALNRFFPCGHAYIYVFFNIYSC